MLLCRSDQRPTPCQFSLPADAKSPPAAASTEAFEVKPMGKDSRGRRRPVDFHRRADAIGLHLGTNTHLFGEWRRWATQISEVSARSFPRAGTPSASYTASRFSCRRVNQPKCHRMAALAAKAKYMAQLSATNPSASIAISTPPRGGSQPAIRPDASGKCRECKYLA